MEKFRGNDAAERREMRYTAERRNEKVMLRETP